MTSTTVRPKLARLPWFLSSTGDSPDALAYIGPNWYASVMGTGIIANAGAAMPVHVTGLHNFALVVWLLDLLLLSALLVATGLHWAHHPSMARSHGRDVSMAQFYGAPPWRYSLSAPALS